MSWITGSDRQKHFLNALFTLPTHYFIPNAPSIADLFLYNVFIKHIILYLCSVDLPSKLWKM